MISSLGCSWLPALSLQLVSLHDFPSGLLLAAAAALFPQLVSLHDFPSGLLLAAAAALFPQLVSLHDFPSGLLLAAAAALSLSLFPFMISLPEESMVSEHLRIRNKKRLLYEYLKTHFASLEMLFGAYASVILSIFCFGFNAL